jgi:hypothetical protein
MVGAKGFEPSTSWSRTRRASQAALRPDNAAESLNCGLSLPRQISIGTRREPDPVVSALWFDSLSQLRVCADSRPWGENSFERELIF